MGQGVREGTIIAIRHIPAIRANRITKDVNSMLIADRRLHGAWRTVPENQIYLAAAASINQPTITMSHVQQPIVFLHL